MLVGFFGVLLWFATLGYSFWPKPPLTPTPTPAPPVGRFDGATAYRHVLIQELFGPRISGSEPLIRASDYISLTLRRAGWQVELQEFQYRGVTVRNVIGRAGQGPVGIVAAHYDTRRRADRDLDPARRAEPVPGANDGASGTAVLLELARAVDKTRLTNEVWLTFFDAEDNGQLDGWDWTVGSQYMAQRLTIKPEFVIIADMVGDADLQLYRERTSTVALQDELWAIAGMLGYGGVFLQEPKHSITDDHTPFLQRGFPAVDIIDFDYPYWHTTQDTADKVAPTSLEYVGRVLQAYLERRYKESSK